jgi:DNA-binding LacI/PurR family transcriptional regulator
MPATQKDIASKLGVSQRLVSYALSGQKRVSETTRQRILQEAKNLGYTPNRMARALVTGRTHQIALLFQFSTSLNNEMTRQFQNLTKPAYDLLSISAADQVRTPGELAVDGAVFYGSIPPEIITPYPVVEMVIDLRGKSAGTPPRQDMILMPIEEASRAAMQHLLEQKCKRIAFVSTPGMMMPFEPRYRAYCHVMKKAGLPIEKITLESPFDKNYRDNAQFAMEKYFPENGFPDALFCSNDDIAIGAYRVLRKMGRRIPEQTAVIGCDDIEESRDHVPALTSIQFPCEAICKCAWEMLTARIENPHLPPRMETFKAKLVKRDSSLRDSKVLLLDDP